MPEENNDSRKVNGWDQSKLLVNAELTRLSNTIERVEERHQERFDTLERLIADLRVDLAVQKTKVSIMAAVYGILGGVMSSLTYFLVELFVRHP